MLPTSPPVFVSYASKDKALVHPLADWLAAEGIGVWIDRDQIRGGQYFGTEIVRGIGGAKAFLLMCSPHSMASEVVYYEVAYSVSAGVHARLPVWLTPVVGSPIDAYPPRIRLFLPHQCLFVANLPPATWHEQVKSSLLGMGIRPTPEPLPSADEYKRAAANGDWATVIRLGERLLRTWPGDEQLLRGVAGARRRLEAERESLVARLAGQPTPADWDEYLTRFPDGPLTDHAKFRLAGSLPLPALGPFLGRCAVGGTAAWQIADAIARLRLKDRTTARQRLDQLRVVEPTNAAAAYFSAVAQVAMVGVSKMTLERIGPVNELLTLCWQLAPTCGYPWLLAAYLAREYHERKQQRGPFGSSAELQRGAAAAGLTASDHAELHALLS